MALLKDQTYLHRFSMFLQYVIEDLEGNNRYIVQIRAGTKSLSNPEKTWFGEATEEKSLYLPTENCKPGIFEADFRGELSAGMIVGAVCAVLFLFLAVIGFVIWRWLVVMDLFTKQEQL